ncbi:MAG: TOBE domain-containing protein, partial [Actinomycetota bacterium]|nr:TOBE domain-containing protein [Actinomycetota bacterium]
VADLVGLNLVAGTLAGHTLTTAGGATVVIARGAGDGPAFVAIRPQAVSLHRHHPEGSARNVWRLTVDDVDHRDERARVSLTGQLTLTAEVTPGALIDLAIRPGDPVWASVKATDVSAYAV